MHHKVTAILIGMGLIIICTVPLFAQATFSTAATPLFGADIGFAEMTGGIVLTVASGTTVASSFDIQYSAPITNNNASEIIVVGTGSLSGISSTPILNRSRNSITLDVPAGGTVATGSTIRIAGVRVALAGGNYSTVTATISGSGPSGNAILAGQSILTVINSIQAPFTVTLGDPVTWSNGAINSASPSVSVKIKESYAGAFSSYIGLYGQTQPSQLRVTPFPAIPPGVTLTFPATVVSLEDGAFITTTSGISETVPRTDGSTEVVYNYTAVPLSTLNKESFNLNVTVAVAAPATSGRVTFQVTLLPLNSGDPESPSTEIPRYAERLVPDETELSYGFSQLAFPFQAQSSGTYTGIAITNPIDARVNVTLTAYNTGGMIISGAGITNPVTVTMPRMGQFAKVANEVFGQNFNASTGGTIRATASTTILPGFYLEGIYAGQGLDGTTANVSPLQNWIWPSVFHGGTSPFNLFQIFNPSSGAAATATLKLYDSNGSLISSASQVIPGVTDTTPGGGTLLGDLKSIFPSVDLSSFTGGYVKGSSDAALVVSENFGNALDSNILQGQTPIQQTTFNIAHFASGGGYVSELNIVNSDSGSGANVTLTLFDNTGTQTSVAGNPLKLTIQQGGQLVKTLDQLFPSLGGSLTTGYIRVNVEPFFVGPFGSTAILEGSIRFSSADGSGSAALPLLVPPATDFYYSHIAQNLGYYTGIAIFNPGTTKADVNLDVFTKDGTLVGSFETLIQPGQKISKLLYEMVRASYGQIGGYVHVRSDQPVVSFSLFGTDDGKVLSAIPPQSAVQ